MANDEPKSCRRATELISLSMDRPLKAAERRALRAHLLICRSCRAFRDQVDGLRRFLRDPSTRRLPTSFLMSKLSPEARERIKQAVEARLES